MAKSPLSVLQQYWGYLGFRPMQEEIIQSILKGNDTLALLPTGGGKSICFQVPALCQEGLAIVISPLIALMKDQVERLNRLGIPATYLTRNLSRQQIDAKLQTAMDGGYKFLYLAPERIGSEMFQMRLEKMPVSMLAVDEAHCISQWGYDFRPSYLEISKIRELLPRLPIIALTASATPAVEEDIKERLELKDVNRFAKTFRRDNLRYLVLEEENVIPRIHKIVSRTQGTGIIYARTRKRTEQVSKYLQEQGVSAIAYHGGLANSVRNERQQAWIDNEHRVMVATNAFGMGIDKPDVRFVVHYNLPADLESYYQEAGRGGRDGQTAFAIAFRNRVDLAELKRWQDQKYPSWEQIQNHYDALCHFFRIPSAGIIDEDFDLDIQIVAKQLNTGVMELFSSLKILDQEQIIDWNEDSDDFAYLQVIAQPGHILNFKQQHPRLAKLIDFMLRTCGGEVYIQEVRFLPQVWARKLPMNEEDLFDQLNKLAQYNLIQYKTPRGRPTIRFLQSRKKLSYDELNWEKYTFLQEQSETRLERMFDYVNQMKGCRSLMIQNYFGENSDEHCGKCDLCINFLNENLSEKQFQRISDAIIQLLQKKGSLSYRDTLAETGTGKPKQKETTLRLMLDKKLLLVDELGNIKLPH